MEFYKNIWEFKYKQLSSLDYLLNQIELLEDEMRAREESKNNTDTKNAVYCQDVPNKLERIVFLTGACKLSKINRLISSN